MTLFLRTIAISALTIALGSGGAALAQANFGGSFEGSGGASVGSGVQPPTPPAGSVPPPSAQTGTEGGAFCGSFGCEGGGSGTGVVAGPAVQPSPPPPPPPGPPIVQVEPAPPPPPANPPPTPQPQNDPNSPAAQVLAFETRDYGVAPQQQLRSGQFHSPTPSSIPGGQVVSTQNLANAMQQNIPMVVIDVLGGQYALPNAYSATPMAEGGNFSDRMQQQTAQWLGQITQGNRGVPIVVYCSDPMCWLSYNGALRAINAGYTNVYWYRGGIQAWQMAGLPMQPSGY